MKRTVLLSALALTASLSFGQIASGLYLQYDFNNGTATDMSGNGNHGTASNTTVTADRFGNVGYAYHFDGDSSVVYMPDSALTDTVVSISIWFKATAPGVIIGQQNNNLFTSSSNWVPLIYIKNDSTLYSGYWQGSIVNVTTSTANLIDGQWHHVVLAADQNSQTVYLDGAQAGTSNGMAFFAGMVSNQIGGGRTDAGWPGGNGGLMMFAGDLDDLRVYHKTLSATEADSLYNDPNPFVVGIEESYIQAVKVYPNPAHDMVNFSEISNVVLTDMTGKTLVQLKGTKSLNLGAQPSGMYIIHFLDDSGNAVFRQKVQKQ